MKQIYIVVDEWFEDSYQIKITPFYDKDDAIKELHSRVDRFLSDNSGSEIENKSEYSVSIKNHSDNGCGIIWWNKISVIETIKMDDGNPIYAVINTIWCDCCDYFIDFLKSKDLADRLLIKKFKDGVSHIDSDYIDFCNFSSDSYEMSDGRIDYRGFIQKID